jgi:hypothetical protein
MVQRLPLVAKSRRCRAGQLLMTPVEILRYYVTSDEVYPVRAKVLKGPKLQPSQVVSNVSNFVGWSFSLENLSPFLDHLPEGA